MVRAALVSSFVLVAAVHGQPAQPEKVEPPSVTRHSVMIGGEEVRYTATAGFLVLPDYEGKAKANVFYVAYTRDAVAGGDARPTQVGQEDPTRSAGVPSARPITFAFNGGPGSSSVWLHLGAFGPRRVVMGAEGNPTAPPYRLVDNEFSWLSFTDLVFIDPVSTGYSRPVSGEAASQFHGLEPDVRAVGDFIRLYTTRNRRWSSPKYLAGESYGTTRAAALAGHLQDEFGMYLSGITLVSPVLNFQTIRFDTGNDLPYALYLPGYTATAWYHGRLAPELQADLGAAVAESRAWALGEYTMMLAKGDGLSEGERRRCAEQVARLTGLSPRFVAGANLRVTLGQFTKELLRERGVTVGRLDSRYTGIDSTTVGASPEYDPSMSAIMGPFTGALNAYVREELEFESDAVYEILTSRVQPWSYARSENRYVNVGETLRRAMVRNRSLRVHFACGYYDLATPFAAAEYTASHLGLPEALRGNVTLSHYESGHMMYVRLEDLARMHAEAAAFYAAPAPEAALVPGP